MPDTTLPTERKTSDAALSSEGKTRRMHFQLNLIYIWHSRLMTYASATLPANEKVNKRHQFGQKYIEMIWESFVILFLFKWKWIYKNSR